MIEESSVLEDFSVLELIYCFWISSSNFRLTFSIFVYTNMKYGITIHSTGLLIDTLFFTVFLSSIINKVKKAKFAPKFEE